MGWLEGILEFLRHGPNSGGRLDMNALFQGGMDSGNIDGRKAIREINSLIKWQTARKKWHQDKTRQKMASAGDEPDPMLGGMAGFKSSDFGLNEVCPTRCFSPHILTHYSLICKTLSLTTMPQTQKMKKRLTTMTTLSKPSARTARERRRSLRGERASPRNLRLRRSRSYIQASWRC
jgi:hypothetical protein